MSLTKVQVKRIRRLVARLRNGTHRQAFEQLRDTGNGRCCLGVACDVAVEDGVLVWEHTRAVGTGKIKIDGRWDQASSYLPPSAMLFFGFEANDPELPDSPQVRAALEHPNVSDYARAVIRAGSDDHGSTTLAELNDAQVPHPVLADLIEQHWLPEDWAARHPE